MGRSELIYTPRRFGKTLNMHMLKSFFEIGTNPMLFQGLEIAKEKDLCERYLGQFPVIFISLKSVEGKSFESALKKMELVFQKELRRLQFLRESTQLTDLDKQTLETLYRSPMGVEM